ncbi:MAG TPA: hypothetical protein VN613_12535 [Gemmatimonadaceae bacterium]|nr:hypothetical protein [Gemmatimonadaceae bacterium]
MIYRMFQLSVYSRLDQKWIDCGLVTESKKLEFETRGYMVRAQLVEVLDEAADRAAEIRSMLADVERRMLSASQRAVARKALFALAVKYRIPVSSLEAGR